MAKKRIRRGVRVWTWRKHPDTAWLELGKRMTEHYLDLDGWGIAFLTKIPFPYNVIATAVASKNRRQVRRKKGPNGVWIKFSLLQPFVKARKRTRKNKGKRPKPW